MSNLIGKYFKLYKGEILLWAVFISNSNNVSYDDFINSCLDKGISVKEVDKKEYDECNIKIEIADDMPIEFKIEYKK